MPVQQGKSAISGKLKGYAGHFDKHKNDETTLPTGGDLPPGIENGVAELTVAKIDEYKTGDNKGKLYLMLAGVVLEPAEVAVPVKDGNGNTVHINKVRTVGMRVQKMIGLIPSKDGSKTVDDRIAESLNEMRKMGVDTSALKIDDVEDALKALEQEAPRFYFRTWQGQATKQFPNPTVQVQLKGKVAEDYTAPAAEAVDDQSGEADSGSDAAVDENGSDGTDWVALGEAADGGDQDAEDQIKEAGEQYGVDTDSYATWSEAAAAIAKVEAGDVEDEGEGEAEEPEEPWVPKVGDVYDYKPKGARKAETHEVTAVFTKAMTVNLKGPKGVIKGVKFTSEPPTLGGQEVK